MNDHELSVTTPESLLVTWKIPIFSQLSQNNACYLLSPGFKFVGDSFRLRLFNSSYDFYIVLQTTTNTAPTNDVSYEIGLKSVTGKEIEIDHRNKFPKQLYYFPKQELEKERRVYFSDGNITVFCFMRMRGPSSAENPVYSKTEIPNLVKSYGLNLSWFLEPFGELSFEAPRSLHVLWKIPNFLKLTEQSEYFRKSPDFSFGDDRYCLRLFSSRQSGHLQRVSFKLVNVLDIFPKTDVSYEVGLKSSTGKEIGIDRNKPTGQLTLTQPVPSLAQFLLDREYFTDRECILKSLQHSAVPVGPLTVFCSLRLREPNNAGDRTSDEEEQERLPGMTKLQSDLRELLKKKLESDATLVVGGKEFPAHKNILRTRSSVFEAMFGHEMSEKESGRVVIDDLDPETFGCFLEYLYTGVVGAGLSDNNVFELYKAAHKYNVPTLKSVCVAHLRRNMSVDFFCEVLSLALLYKEQELFQKAVEFFQRNMDPIILTAKWQQFLIENGTVANELLVKAITFKRQ